MISGIASALGPGGYPTIKLWFRGLDVDDHDGLATKKVWTVIDCAKDLPFESVLRAIALDVRGLSVKPQTTIDELGFSCRPDLVDEQSPIVIEADSFEFRSSRAALAKDIARHTNLVVRGWRVVRFSWEDVMFAPAYVRACLVALVEGPDSLATSLVSTRMCA